MPADQALTFQTAFAPAFSRVRVSAAIRMFALGVCMALAQLAVLPVAQHDVLVSPEKSLLVWDSHWYEDIALHGYRSTIAPYPGNLRLSRAEFEAATNVAFFPAYPALINVVRALTGVGMLAAMLIVSQFFAAVMWAYLLALLARLRIPMLGRVAAVALVFVHPGAFFQVVAYSESLFLANLLGFLYWNLEHRHRYAVPLMLLHGFLMCATKLVAFPVAVLPLVLALWRMHNKQRASLQNAALTSLASVSGGVLFLAYCWRAFGYWDLYIQRQRIGWQINPDMFFWLHWPPRFLIPEVFSPLLASAQICRFVVAGTSWFFVALIAIDIVRALRRTGAQWTERIAMYWCALSMFYVFVAGFTELKMEAMVRHLFGTYVLLVLLTAHVLRMTWKPAWNRCILPLAVAVGIYMYGSVVLQHLLIVRFTTWQWVA